MVLDGLKAAEKLATKPGAKALYTVPRNKVLEIQRAVDLEQAGDLTAASTLFALRKELGGAKFDGVYDTLENGNLRVVDDVEAATIKGRGVDNNQIEPAVLDKWQAKYPNANLTADGDVIKVNNQIKIHPDKLDEVDEATLNTIVQSTQELDAVGGDITKVSPDTQKAIKDLTSTNGGRWRFEYQTNGIVNQYLDYVGLKDNKLFQNMSDGEKKRLFDIPNQMKNLDELPAKAKPKKIEAKAQERMIEQQAATYAIGQNPKDATEFYKTQMNQKIVDLEDRYDKKLEAVVNKIAAREGLNLNVDKLTQKQTVEANRKASQEFFGELYGETTQIDGEKAVDKYIKKRVYENAGIGNNSEQLKPQYLDEIQNAYSTKVAEVGDNIGGIQIESNLSEPQTIQQIKAEANNLKFNDESAAIYHTEKHYGEFPPSHKTGENKFNNYWQSAIETIKKSQNVTSSYDQLSGSRSFVFNHTYEERGVSYGIKTIVKVSSDGIVKIATYFKQ